MKETQNKINENQIETKIKSEIKTERNQILHNCVVAAIPADRLCSDCVNFAECCFVVAIVACDDGATSSTNRI